MRVVALFSFNGGEEAIRSKYPSELEQVYKAIHAIDAESHLTKRSKESRRQYQMLYSPSAINRAFKKEFADLGWKSVRVPSKYPAQYYLPEYTPTKSTRGSFREMDFVKNKIGVEVQFGKYSFMVYNVSAKMTIFNKLGFIDVGIEVVPVKDMVARMSSGVSYFDQFVWDLEHRGVADIDIPVLILGITTDAKQSVTTPVEGRIL
jgi:Restriction endonuclease BglII